MRVIRRFVMLALVVACAGCDPVYKSQVAIDSPTAKGIDCAVQALHAEGLSVNNSEGSSSSHLAIEAGDIYMGLHARKGGYDIYVSRVGKPDTCAEIRQFAPYMRRAVKAISTQCSGSTSPTIQVDLSDKNCEVRVDG